SVCRSVNGEAPVAPSVARSSDGGETRALTVAEIHELAQQWAQAAVRAKKAGWDGVEVHGATNYLLAEFQSSYWNKRTDEYGGDIRNRGRFLVEVLQAIKAAVGPNFPFWARVNLQEFGPVAGVTAEEGKVLAQMVEAAGAYAINVTSFGGGPYGRVPPMGVPKGNMLPIAEAIKKAVKIPVMVTGRLDPAQGEQAIQEGKTDLIVLARSLLSDPELPQKYAEGCPEDVMPCIACGYCNESIRAKSSVQCVVNPALCFEKEMAITPASKPKNVLVIGGGPAGMEAAKIAAMRGHKVTLFEKEKRLGGQLNLAILPPFKEPLKDLLHHLTSQMPKLGIKVELGQQVTPSIVKKLNPDAIIVATGGEPFLPPIPVRDSKPVVQAVDVLAGKAKVGERVVIIGGELVGCETAEYLADKGIKVTVVRRGPDMATKVRPAARTVLLERLNKKGATLIPGVSSYDEINKEGLVLTKNGQRQVIPADTVVIAAGAKPNTSLLDSVKKEQPNTTAIGDLVEPRDVQAAINEGYRAGLKI
ncbi:MAG: FAD-dependent oxidoreductase, partial [Chloroflexota bacterium]